MTGGYDKGELEKCSKLPIGHPLVEDTFFRMQLRIDSGEQAIWPWVEVPKEDRVPAQEETLATEELDARYEKAGFLRPTDGSHDIITEPPSPEIRRPSGWKPSDTFTKPKVSKGRAKYGYCPDCGFYLSLKGSCCPSGKMLVCLECAYTKTYEGK